MLSAGVGDGPTDGEDGSGMNPPGNPPNPAGSSPGGAGPVVWSLLDEGCVVGGTEELEVAGAVGDGVGGSVGDGVSVGVSEGLGVSDGIGDGDSVALGEPVGVGSGVGTGCANAGATRNTTATNAPMLAAHFIIAGDLPVRLNVPAADGVHGSTGRDEGNSFGQRHEQTIDVG